ncbi:MAG TPA: hypothetical protein VJ103_01830 [Candidatus Paceibacterota bacterium]|nr:hypothetical protein [Candidatus Paceibacterota bacterium]
MEQKEPIKLESESQKADRLLADLGKLNEWFRSSENYNALLKEKTDAIDRLQKTHENILSEFGLKLVPAHYLETESGTTPSKIELVTDDLDLFFSKLGNLSQKNLTPGLAALLKEVASGFNYEITRTGTFKTNDFPPQFLAKMTRLEDFTNEYHMIDPKNKWGFNDYLKPLERYFTAHKAGFLQDLLYIESHGLGGTLEDWEKDWGPLKWHLGNDIKTYLLRWKRAATVLLEIKENPKAEKLRTNLINQLLFAINRLELYIPRDAKPTEKDAYLAIILAAKKKLKGMIY